MRALLQSVFYSADMVKQVALQPLVPGSLLAALLYGPTQVREELLQLLQRTAIEPQRLQPVLKVLIALGLVRSANLWLSKVAANNWLLTSPKPWQWSKEIAVITGGSGEIGRLIAQGLAKRGITVVVLDVQALPEELKAVKGIKYFSCDLTSTASISQVADTVRRTIGNPSILINNAGLSRVHGVLETSDEHLQKIFNVNLLSHWTTTREFLPNMILQNKGHIVTVSSMGAFVTVATSTDYSATKAGALAFHEGLGCELRHIYKAPGVITTVVHPSYVQTPMTDMIEYRNVRDQGMLRPDDIANRIVKQILSRQGGQLILPSHLSITSALRWWPTWLQDLIRDLTSKPIVACL